MQRANIRSQHGYPAKLVRAYKRLKRVIGVQVLSDALGVPQLVSGHTRYYATDHGEVEAREGAPVASAPQKTRAGAQGWRYRTTSDGVLASSSHTARHTASAASSNFAPLLNVIICSSATLNC